MLTSLYRRIQFLSIDIVIGAVILLRFFCAHFSVDLTFSIQFLLGASVWIIYTIDHLRDALKAPESKRERYQFHLRHSRRLKMLLVIVSIACIYALFHISSIVIIAGSFLALLSGVYLIIQRMLAKWGLKELYVAIIYTSGILLVPFITIEMIDYVIFFQLLLLTFLNLITFSWFEREDDFKDGFISIASVVGNSTLRRLIILISLAGIVVTLLSTFSELYIYFTIAFLLFAILMIASAWAQKSLRYRTLGDGIFILPIIFEWL